MAVDAVGLLVGWSVGYLIVSAGTDRPLLSLSSGLGTIAPGVAAAIACFASAGLYRPPVNGIRSGALGRLVRAMAMAAAICVVWQGLVGDGSPGVALAPAGAALVATVIARCGFDAWLIGRRESGTSRIPVVLAGAADETTELVEFLQLNPEAGLVAVAVVGEPPVIAGDGNDPPWMGGLEHAGDAVRRSHASGVLVAVNTLPSSTVNDLVQRLSSDGIPVHLSTGLTGVSRARLQTFDLAHEPMVLVRPPRHSAVQEVTKRALDVVVASVLLVVAAPVIAVAAALIKTHDRGPVFFRQVRIGRGGTPFTLLKLRTMEVEAEARLADLRSHNERHGPLFKVSNDPRITPIGGFLRSTAIDELPQLLNVLSGRMSIVGPRPALPAETAEFDEELQRRHLVRPGVTGLWQVEANHKASFEEYRRLDLFYARNWSLGIDLAVMVDTVQAISRRVLRALRRPAPTAPAPVAPAPVGSPPATDECEVGP
jgi:exopolysaccharide biosynthesis polyprenyl glycosylphosphotransferase